MLRILSGASPVFVNQKPAFAAGSRRATFGLRPKYRCATPFAQFLLDIRGTCLDHSHSIAQVRPEATQVRPSGRSAQMRVQFIWPNFDCPIGLNIGIAYL